MTKSGECQIPARFPSKTLTTDASLLQHPRRLRRRIRNPNFPGAGFHPRKDAVSETPFLRWKINSRDLSAGNPPASDKRSRPKGTSGRDVPVSARKLASSLWHFLLPEASSVHVVWHGANPCLCYPIMAEYDTKIKNPLWGPLSLPHLKNSIMCKTKPSVTLLNPAMEKATKWDLGFLNTPDNVFPFYGHLKLHEDEKLITISVISTLVAELKQSQSRICELETKHRSIKKKLERFLRKLTEERNSRRSQEHERTRAMIDDVKDELNRERKNRKRMEIVNFKLVSELAEAKLSAKKFSQDYEKERKTREIMEEICNELTKEIQEDKAEVEDLKSESMRIREEAEEERRMLQMAEVWREERVQMKLIDAKLTLEEKYSQLRKLVADLDAFLRSRSTTANVVENREAELLKEAACSVKIQDIKFSYQPPASEDIFSVFEDLQSSEANERKIEPCHGYSTTSPTLEIDSALPELNGLYERQVQRHTTRDRDIEDGSGRETVSHGVQQGFCRSPKGRDQSVKRICEESDVSTSGSDWEENTDDDMLNIEVGELGAALESHSRTKESSPSSLRRLYPSYSEKCKAVETTDERVSTGIASSDIMSVKAGPYLPSLVHWGSLNSGNPQKTREMKGCDGCPGGIKKSSLMAKFLEERLENEKDRLGYVLEPKIQSK